jgi:membrane protease YdiL (CAAX protease family)
MTALEDGREGLKLMVRRLGIWQVGFGYWLFACLFIPGVILLGSLINPLFNGDIPSFSSFGYATGLLPLFLIFVIVAGLGQELGWTGCLLPRLQARFNALTSCSIRAILSGLWHLPLFFYAGLQHPALADFPYGGWISQKGFLFAFGVLLLFFQLPWSIFFGWVFKKTRGSLLLATLLHGSEFWVAFWMIAAGIDSKNLNNYWGFGALLLVAAAILVIWNGPQNLSCKHSRVFHKL